MTNMTQEYIKQCFDYEDGKLFWKERPRDHFNTDRGWKIFNTKYAGKEAGCIAQFNTNKPPRWVVKFSGILVYRYRLIYILHYGDISPDLIMDHIDGDTLNDRIENLRMVTYEINSYNSRKRKDNVSGVTGVSFNKRMGKWRARASQNNKDIILYLGDDFDEAVEARKAWESSHPHMTPRHGT